jgi:hypothetical protein
VTIAPANHIQDPPIGSGNDTVATDCVNLRPTRTIAQHDPLDIRKPVKQTAYVHVHMREERRPAFPPISLSPIRRRRVVHLDDDGADNVESVVNQSCEFAALSAFGGAFIAREVSVELAAH